MKNKFLIFPLVFFIFSLLFFLKVYSLNFFPDFSVTYSSSKLAISSINPYLTGNHLFVPQVYPPVFMVLVFPLTIFTFILSEKIWLTLSIISIFFSVYLIFKIFNHKLFSSLGFLVLGLVFLSFPEKFTVGMGQINNFILLFVVLGIYFFNKNREVLSGSIFSLSLGLKFFPIFFPLYFILTKKWKILISLIISLIVLYSIAFVFINPKINFYFYKEIFPSFLSGWKTDYYNQSLIGFIGRMTTDNLIREFLKYSISFLFTIVSFFAVIKTLKNKKLLNIHLGLLITLNLIINNFSWQHHFVFAIFPMISVLFYILKNNLPKKYLFFLFVSYLLISINIVNSNQVSVLLTSHVLYGAILLWFLQIFLLRQLDFS